MIGQALREPVSAWSHFLWMAAAIPALVPLWRAAGSDPLKRRGAAVFGFSLVFCSAGSFLFHSVPTEFMPFFQTMDHIGIFLLIAGTVTPIGLVVLDGRWRLTLVGGIWLLAFVGVSLRLKADQPMGLMTALYLFMGWVGCLAYCELARRLTHQGMRMLWVGGIFYTIGAVINSLRWPEFAPGVFEAHELFHLFVVAGSACHYWFVVRVVMAYRGLATESRFEDCSFAVKGVEDRIVVAK